MIKIKVFPDPVIDYDFENVYRPADDTYLIVDYFKYHIDSYFFDGIALEKIGKILDMGTGTGYIALSLQIIKTIIPRFNPKIYASDILEEAIILSKHNERLNSFDSEIEFINSDLFNSFPFTLKHSFDVIIFNPPYLPSSNIIQKDKIKKKIDYSWDGGELGFETFLRFLDEAKDFLKLNSNSRIYYVNSNRINLEQFNQLIFKKGYKRTYLNKIHVFHEDIYLNRLELSPN
ncbi:MAG: methyltransferase [Promethearchaeota archaeon]